jgi:hypothetical protein
MVTIAYAPTEGGTCPGAATAEPNKGSTMMESTLCSLTVSSPATSSTLHFECLGFKELVEKNQ